jgi:hypothetical protein
VIIPRQRLHAHETIATAALTLLVQTALPSEYKRKLLARHRQFNELGVRKPLNAGHVDLPVILCIAAAFRRKSSAMPFGCISGFPLPAHDQENAGRERDLRFVRDRAPVGNEVRKALYDQIRQRAHARDHKWHMNEVVISIGGENTGFGARSIRKALFSTPCVRRHFGLRNHAQ